MPTTTVSTRLDPEEIKLMDLLGELSGLDRSSLIKALLRRGMRELRLEHAAAAHRKGDVTLSRAAEIAGLGLWELLARMDEQGLDLHYDLGEFEADLAALASSS